MGIFWHDVMVTVIQIDRHAAQGKEVTNLIQEATIFIERQLA